MSVLDITALSHRDGLHREDILERLGLSEDEVQQWTRVAFADLGIDGAVSFGMIIGYYSALKSYDEKLGLVERRAEERRR